MPLVTLLRIYGFTVRPPSLPPSWGPMDGDTEPGIELPGIDYKPVLPGASHVAAPSPTTPPERLTRPPIMKVLKHPLEAAHSRTSHTSHTRGDGCEPEAACLPD